MNTTANLGKAPVRTLVLQLAIPSMTAQFVNVLYSIIDRMYTYTLMIIPLSFQYVFVDGLTALECPKTGLALSVTRKSLFVISAAVLPSFFGAKAAFFAEPVADGISSVLSTIVFLLLINRHLDKRCRMDKKESL